MNAGLSRPPAVVGEAADLGERIRATNRRSPFAAAVRDFRHLLDTVTGHAAAEVSTWDVAALIRTAEGVVSRIEQRLTLADDPPDMQLELAKAVYSIRRSLEEIDRWHRHYASE